MSSKVPSPRARYSRLGNPCGWQTYTSSSPSPSTSATATPWWPFESRASAESSVVPQSSRLTLSCRRNESIAPKAAVVTSVKMGTEALLRVSLQGRPLDDAPAGRSLLPAHLPPADALDAVGRAARTHEVVAHLGGGRAPLPIHRESGDQELGGGDLAELLKQPRELRRRTPARRGPAPAPSPAPGRPGAPTCRRRPPPPAAADGHRGSRCRAGAEAARAGSSPCFSRALSSDSRAISSPATRSSGKKSMSRAASRRKDSSVSEHRERRPVDVRLSRATAEAPPGPAAGAEPPAGCASRAGSSASPASRARRALAPASACRAT